MGVLSCDTCRICSSTTSYRNCWSLRFFHFFHHGHHLYHLFEQRRYLQTGLHRRPRSCCTYRVSAESADDSWGSDCHLSWSHSANPHWACHVVSRSGSGKHRILNVTRCHPSQVVVPQLIGPEILIVQLLGHIFQNNFVLVGYSNGVSSIYLGVETFIPLRIWQALFHKFHLCEMC
jgi:hypothetical protein